MDTKNDNDAPQKGYWYARSASREIACVHKHRTEVAARKCADGIHQTATVVFIPIKELKRAQDAKRMER